MRYPPVLLACVLLGCATTRTPKPATPEPGTGPAQASTGAPPTFVRTTAEAPAMRSIEVRDGLTHAQLMRTLVDALSERYVVDVVDPRAGFAMTTWQASLMRDGAPDLRYRTRLVARYVDDWNSLQLRSEARWTRGEEADVGYDAAQLDSMAVVVNGKVGKKP